MDPMKQKLPPFEAVKIDLSDPKTKQKQEPRHEVRPTESEIELMRWEDDGGPPPAVSRTSSH